MASSFDIEDWYWTVNDSSPSTQVFASARGIFVVLADATYTTWLAAEGGNSPTIIDTIANLYVAIADAAYSRQHRGAGKNVQSFAVDITLTNPLQRVQILTPTAGGKVVNLPQQNLANSSPIAVPIYFVNASATISYQVVSFTGSTLITVRPGSTMILIPTQNDTTGGGFQASGNPPATLPLSVLLGGTSADLSATGGTSQFLRQNSAGAAIDVVQPAFSMLSGSVAASQLPNPSSTTLGGIESLASVASKWINQISTSGVPSATQPAATDLSDYATGSWTPADASGASLTFANVAAHYIKIAGMVFAYARFDYPVTADGTNSRISGLPVTVGTGSDKQIGFVAYTTNATLRYITPDSAATTATPATSTGGRITNATLSSAIIIAAFFYPAT